MALNRMRPHLLVLPEDDATRNIANGFSDVAVKQMQVLNPAGGWPRVLDDMIHIHAPKMRQFRDCHMVLLIDFDDEFPTRIAKFKQDIPADVADRVYVVGAYTEAETLQQATRKKPGQIGRELANECVKGLNDLWNHPQVHHNQPEVQRLQVTVKSIIF